MVRFVTMYQPTWCHTPFDRKSAYSSSRELGNLTLKVVCGRIKYFLLSNVDKQ